MSELNLDHRVETYIRKVRGALFVLPGEVREDAVAELRSHALDRLESGATPDEILGGFGPPEAYAQALFDAHMLSGALTTRRFTDLLSALARRVAKDATAAVAGLLVLIIWGVALTVAAVSLMKITDPAHAGLWVSPTQVFIGVIDNPASAREVLGVWIFPLAFGVLLAAWMATRWLAFRALWRLTR